MKKAKGRSVLGRGLEALIPTTPLEPTSGGLSEVDIDRITPNAWQPRDHFDSEHLDALAQSIRENGIIQPLVLRPFGADFQIVAGERRWRAAQLAGLKRVPAVIKSLADDRLLQVALVENIQRQDLSPLEMAKAFRLLIDEYHLKQEDVANRVGMNRSSIANYMRLLALPEPVRDALERGRIDMGHARALAGLDDDKAQVAILQAVLRGGLSVRQAELLVQRAKAGEPAQVQADAPARRDPNILAAEARLQRTLGTRVRIVRSSSGAGKIVVRFKSDEELDRLFAVLLDDQEAPGAR
jgi:ParB family chromosome partitioning protein